MFSNLLHQLSVVILCVLKMVLIFGGCSIILGGLMCLTAHVTRDKAVNRKLYSRVIKGLK